MGTWFKRLRYLGVTLPLVFVLLFFGYLPPKFDVVLYTDNIQGEGICMTYVCPPVAFSPFYETGFYFGSELQKATIPGYHYDVSDILLTVSDVTEADLLGFDINMFGHTVRHYDLSELVPEGVYTDLEISPTPDGKGMHFTFFAPEEGTTLDLAPPLIPVWFWIAYWSLILLLSALLALGLGYLLELAPGFQLPVLSGAAILVALLAGCFFCGSLPYVNYTDFLLNWILLLATALFINALTVPFLGTVLTMGFTTVWYIANYFVIMLRNKPIMPADLKAIGTAAEVMGGYTFLPSWRMVVGVAAVILYAVAVIMLWMKTRHQGKPTRNVQLLKRGITAAAAVVLMIVSVNTPAFKALNSFAWDAALLKSFHEEGMVLTHLKSALNSGVKEPDGYSQELVHSYLTNYPQQSIKDESAVHPTNIIMVMNEAFSDLRTVGMDESIDVMPFVDSLDENTIEGSLYVSIFGGGTCNTEFEALTGNSLAFLGVGAYPYTENVTEPLFSLASYFRDNGYITEAFHANEAQNWNRNMVYPNLGFSKFNSITDYAAALDKVSYLHGHPADSADYSYIESKDKEYSDQPRFLFNVTMQNHSGYERWEDVKEAETVAENGAELYLDTKVYLSLIKASDDEVKQLVETYEDSDEPTMIIFFGDHQPGLPSAARSEIYTETDSILDLFKTKFFIWTNYETETEQNVSISANYLPWLILERGNFPLPPYVQMLKEVHERYPVISSQGVIDAEGNVYGSVAELVNDPLIQKYQYIQYANLFDEIDEAWFDAG